MQAPVTTNAVRRMLEELGAIKPTRRAVRMVAIKTEGGPFETSHWILRFDQGRIRTAIEACKGLEGEASYRAFALALQENKA